MCAIGANRSFKIAPSALPNPVTERLPGVKMSTFQFRWAVPAIFICTSAVAEDPTVAVGDSKAHVLDVLGPPEGRLAIGASEVLSYRRGIVEIRAGAVAGVELLSEEEAENLRQRRERERIQRQQAAEERRIRLLEEGTAEKKRVLSDPSFAEQPLRDQLGYWRDFKARYPGVQVEAEYNTVLKKFREEEELERLRAEAERLKAEDPGPKPRVSRKKKRKMQRAGQWKWSPKEDSSQ